MAKVLRLTISVNVIRLHLNYIRVDGYLNISKPRMAI